jgi:hypothetical protein
MSCHSPRLTAAACRARDKKAPAHGGTKTGTEVQRRAHFSKAREGKPAELRKFLVLISNCECPNQDNTQRGAGLF